MPLSFPSNPTVNQQATINGRTYRWTGSVWEFVSSGGGSGLTWSSVPASATASGTAGQIAYDGSSFYVCVATNTWKRTGLTTWKIPTAINGLQLWLDASDASTLYDATSGGSLVAADGAVARWEDKSGNGRHATQSNSGRPYRRAGYLDFAPAFMRLSSSAFPYTGDFALFVVASTPAGGTPFCFQDNSAPNPIIRFDCSPSGSLSITTRGTVIARASTSVSVGTEYYLVTITRTSGELKVFINQTQVLSASDSSSFAANINPALMSYVDNSSSPENGTGKYGEIASYSSAVSPQNVTALENYLKSKWSIT